MPMKFAPTASAMLLLASAWVASSAIAEEVYLDKIQLPGGFHISVYAENVPNARQMALGDKGTLFVGSRRAGNLYAVVDADGDHKAETVHTIASGLSLPSGVAFRDGSLYVGAVSTIYRYDDIESKLEKPPEPAVVRDDFPSDRHHGWKYLAFGPDGKLYVPVGAPCNVCLEQGYAVIKRMNPDGTELEDFALGVRNSVGMTWHPQSQELWFTDNGRDMLGDNSPNCELNHAPTQGLHFGFPHCHGGTVPDPEFAQGRECSEFVGPAQPLGPHVAPLGLKFYTGKMFPEKFHNRVFIAEHGSWNRSSKVGYRVTMVTLEGDRAVRYEPFAQGWLQGEDNWGRPNDVLIMPDGAMLVSDDQAGVIYRITYGN
jgi:glucose/arabinose dehydrogenase